MKTFILTVALGLWLSATCLGQIEGFWKVEKVEVGDKTMTPVAKWFKINPDHTQQTGNGWLQNGEGTWTFDKQASLFFAVTFNDVKDEAGPFQVSFENEMMIWIREEEGMLVKVILGPITELPKSPADFASGLWALEKVEKNEKNLTEKYNPYGNRYIHLSWTRNFVDNNGPEGRISGIWQMNSHRPEISFIRNNENTYTEQKFKVLFEDAHMMLMGISENEKGVEMTFIRIEDFPEN